MIKASIRLDVYVLTTDIACIQYTLGVITILARLINFKLYTEKAFSLSVKDWVGFVIVFLNAAAISCFVTAFTIRVVVIIEIMRVILMNDASAILARRIVVLIAAVAERIAVCTGVIVTPNSGTAMVAVDSIFIKALFTVIVMAKENSLILSEFGTAGFAKVNL